MASEMRERAARVEGMAAGRSDLQVEMSQNSPEARNQECIDTRHGHLPWYQYRSVSYRECVTRKNQPRNTRAQEPTQRGILHTVRCQRYRTKPNQSTTNPHR